MDGTDLKKLLWMWATLPFLALNWAIAWHWLPERVVMKNGPNGQPLGWATPSQALGFDLKLLAGVLTFFTAMAFLVAFGRPGRGSLGATAMMLAGWFVCLLLTGVLWFVQV